MKITRKQLRQLIIEAARTIIVDPEGVATPADQAFRSGREKDAAMARLHPKLGRLMDLDSEGGTSVGDDMRSDRIMARVLADTIPLEDESMRPEPLTSAEARAIDDLGYDSVIQDHEPAETIFNFDAINLTLGLPFIRISPDHGPNTDMIGKNKSDPKSLTEAIKFLNKHT